MVFGSPGAMSFAFGATRQISVMLDTLVLISLVIYSSVVGYVVCCFFVCISLTVNCHVAISLACCLVVGSSFIFLWMLA